MDRVSAAEVSVDGRRARRDRGRLAVIEAVLDLLEEGENPPLASHVAKRAGVSSATLFRYFETLDELQHEATSRFFERNAPLFEVPQIGVGPLGARADRYAAARADLYDQIAPIARLGRARAFDRPVFAETLHSVRQVMADQNPHPLRTGAAGAHAGGAGRRHRPRRHDHLVRVVGPDAAGLRPHAGPDPSGLAWRDRSRPRLTQPASCRAAAKAATDLSPGADQPAARSWSSRS